MKLNRLLTGTLALVLIAGLSSSQAFSQSFPNAVMIIDFESGVYSIVPGSNVIWESKYEEKGFIFQTPIADGQHFDSGPNLFNFPHLAWHEENVNTVNNIILSETGGAAFDLNSFELIFGPQSSGIWANLETQVTASDGRQIILPTGSSGVIVVDWDNITSVTFDIIAAGASDLDMTCIDNFTFDDEPTIVGGEFLPIDSAALLVAGAQTNAVWILSALAVIGSVAFGALYITSKKN